MKVFDKKLYLFTICSLFLCIFQPLFSSTKFQDIKFSGFSGKKNLECRVKYSLNRKKDKFLGTFVIREKNNLLWTHEWQMDPGDLYSIQEFDSALSHEAKKKPIGLNPPESWADKIFTSHYGVQISIQKVVTTDIDEEILKDGAAYNNIDYEKLKTSILASDFSIVVSYRAEWREDLINLVYVESMNKFVCFSRGYVKSSD